MIRYAGIKRGRRAFTLIELLSAIVLILLIMFALSGAVSQALRSDQFANDRLQSADALWYRFERFRKNLEPLAKLAAVEPSALERPFLEGTSKELVFRDVSEFLADEATYRWIRYAHPSQAAVLNSDLPAQRVRDVPLKFDTVSFRYLEGDNWVESWTERQVLPAAVELRIALEAETFKCVVNLQRKGAGHER